MSRRLTRDMASLVGTWRLESLDSSGGKVYTSETHLVVTDDELWDVDPSQRYYEGEPGPEHRYTWDAKRGRLEVLLDGRPNQCGIVEIHEARLRIRWNGLAGRFPSSIDDDYGSLAVYTRETDPRFGERIPRAARLSRQHAALGKLVFDDNLSWWQGRVPLGGAQAILYVSAKQAAPDAVFDEVAALVARIDCAALAAFAAAELLALHNDHWRRDTPALDAATFAARLRPQTLSVTPGKRASLDFHDGDLFWGHSVTVELDGAGLPTAALMQ